MSNSNPVFFNFLLALNHKYLYLCSSQFSQRQQKTINNWVEQKYVPRNDNMTFCFRSSSLLVFSIRRKKIKENSYHENFTFNNKFWMALLLFEVSNYLTTSPYVFLKKTINITFDRKHNLVFLKKNAALHKPWSQPTFSVFTFYDQFAIKANQNQVFTLAHF